MVTEDAVSMVPEDAMVVEDDPMATVSVNSNALDGLELQFDEALDEYSDHDTGHDGHDHLDEPSAPSEDDEEFTICELREVVGGALNGTLQFASSTGSRN
jgi:hypothetical protein